MLAPTEKADDPLFSLLGMDRIISVIDIGSNPIDGEPPYKAMLINKLCSVVGFEPQAQALSVLRKNAGPLETYLPHVIGTGHPGTLHVCKAPGLTSLLEPDPERLSLLNLHSVFGEVIEEIPVETIRLDDLDGQFDFIKIDVQGGELDVFRGGNEKLKSVSVIQTEVSFFRTYIGQPTFAEVDLCLRSMGFILHCFADLKRWPISPAVIDDNPRIPLRQAVEADVVYVRDWTRPMKPEQLKTLAAIAHHVYRSYDLALKAIVLLSECGALSNKAPSHYAELLRGMR